MAQDESIIKSVFNEAGFKMRRIDKLQEIINTCSIDKLATFQGNILLPFLTGKRNYEVIFAAIKQLYAEVYPKLSNDERNAGNSKIAILNKFIKDYPATEKITINISALTPEKHEVPSAAWPIIEDQLTQLELLVRDYLETHEVSGSNKDEDDEGL